jgi:acyl carrier protein
MPVKGTTILPPSPIDSTLEGLVREVMPRRLHKLPLDGPRSLSGELGIDSIGLMSLALRIEEEFQIDLMQHADRFANVRTFGDVRELIDQLAGRSDS